MVIKKMEKQKEYEISDITEEELEILEQTSRKRAKGFYAEVESQLREKGIIKVTVDKRTKAGGLWNQFSKKLGYVVRQYKKSDNEIVVVIMTKEKAKELEKKKQKQ